MRQSLHSDLAAPIAENAYFNSQTLIPHSAFPLAAFFFLRRPRAPVLKTDWDAFWMCCSDETRTKKEVWRTQLTLSKLR